MSNFDAAANDDTPQEAEEVILLLPSRIDVCLPGTPERLLPIPLNRVYNVDDKKLIWSWFKSLNYTVQLLLETASHLSPPERRKLSHPPAVFVHPTTGLILHSTERTYANFAMDCILRQHNSTDPLLLSPSWPSVFFDEDGYPCFPEAEPEEANTASLAGEKILSTEPATLEKNPHNYMNPLEFLPEEEPNKQQYVPKPSKKRKPDFLPVEQQPTEWTTLTFPRL